MVKKAAIAFWGIHKNLKCTIQSIETQIMAVLKAHDISYDVYMHTYYISSPLTNPRTNEFNSELDNEDYMMLHPNYLRIDDEIHIKNMIGFEQYKTHLDYYDTNYTIIDNFILAMYSKQQVCSMILNSGQIYEYVLICHPDCVYETPFDIRYLNIVNDSTICSSNFHVFYKTINHCFFILTQANVDKFSNLFDKLLAYSRIYPIHPEQFIYDCLINTYHLENVYIPFKFNKTQANGHGIPDANDPYGECQEYTKTERNIPYRLNWRLISSFFSTQQIMWIAMINLEYVEYTKNFLKSMEHNNCAFKLLLFCMDNDAFHCMKNVSTNCLCLPLSVVNLSIDISKRICIYGSKDYKNIVFLKLDLTRIMLDTMRPFGIQYLGYIDTDIVLLSDPNPVFINAMANCHDHDIFCQCDENHRKSIECTNPFNCPYFNVGAIVYRNKQKISEIYNYNLDDIAKYRATQAYLSRKFKKLDIKVATIEKNLFLNGSYPGLQSIEPVNFPSSAVLIHYNWVVDANYIKKKFMQTQGHWYI